MIKTNSELRSARGSFSLRAVSPILAITLVGFALRLIQINFQPLWYDEGYSIFFATRAISDLLQRTALDIHPPLYYIFLHYWLNLFGTNAASARLMSILIGAVSIPLLYSLAQKISRDLRVATLAAFLFAISPLAIYYSQEVRMYGLVTFFVLVSNYFFARLFDAPPSRLLYTLIYILATTAALYTQYFAAFILAFPILYVVIVIRNKNIFRRAMLSWLTIVLLYLPWLIFAGEKLFAYVTSKVVIESYATLDPFSFLFQHLAAFSVGHSTDSSTLAFASIIFILLALFGLSQTDQARRSDASPTVLASPRVFIALYLFVPLALGYLINLVYAFHPIRYERLLLFAAPAFYFLVARGLAILAQQRARVAALAIIALCAMSAASLSDFYSAPRYAKEDYRPLIANIQSFAQPGDNLLAIYPWQIGYLAAYYRGAELNMIETPNDAWINDPRKMQNDLNALTQKNPRVWLPALQTQGRILEDQLDANLRARAYSAVDAWFGTTRLELFLQTNDPPRVPRQIAFENNLVVTAWGVTQNEIRAGADAIALWFDWENARTDGLNLSLRLVDRNENIWAQEDRAIENGIQRIALITPNGAPPREYALRLAIYRAQNSTVVHPLGENARADVLLFDFKLSAPAQPNLAAITFRTNAQFANGIQLIGSDIFPEAIQPGKAFSFALYWQTTRQLDSEYLAVTQIKNAAGKTIAESRANIAYGIYPPTAWQVGELVRDPQAFILFGDTPDGTYQISASLENKNGFRERTTDGRDSIALGTLTVKSRPHYFGAPAATNRADWRLDSIARLSGYDLIRDLSRQTARVILYWRALGAPRVAYQGFVHLYNANDQLVAQRDQIPAFPTTSWTNGEYLADAYDIALENLPRGIYKIRVGMYDVVSGARVQIFDAANNLLGDIVELSTRIIIP